MNHVIARVVAAGIATTTSFPSTGAGLLNYYEFEIASLRSLVTGAMLKCRHCEGRSGRHSRGDPKQSRNFFDNLTDLPAHSTFWRWFVLYHND